jgi:hypothetical protein
VPKVKINISLHFSYLMTSNGRTTWPLVDCCTSNRRGQVDLQFDIQQSTNGALQSFHTAHSGTYWHIMPNSGTIRFLTGSERREERRRLAGTSVLQPLYYGPRADTPHASLQQDYKSSTSRHSREAHWCGRTKSHEESKRRDITTCVSSFLCRFSIPEDGIY